MSAFEQKQYRDTYVWHEIEILKTATKKDFRYICAVCKRYECNTIRQLVNHKQEMHSY